MCDFTPYAKSVDNMIDTHPDSQDDRNILICYDLFLKAISHSTNIYLAKKHHSQKIINKIY